MNQATAGSTDQFKQSFREEAREILVELEAALLELNENPGSNDLVGRVFRALHTIKGSGAMFGFDKLAAFTHNLETAFDQVRNGKLAITPELIDLTLAALDQIKVMLEDGAETPEACAEMLARVRRLADIPSRASDGDHAASPVPAPPPTGARRAWRILFAPGPDFMRNGANPLLLLRELGQLGSLSVVADAAAVPPLGELDPERCFLRWEMTLATAAEPEAIRDVFIFVEDTCELLVEPILPEAPNPLAIPAQTTAPLPEADHIARGLEDKRATGGGRRAYDKPETAASLRVPAARLDQFVDLIGELVTVQARLSQISARSDDPEMGAVSEEVERLTSALRESSMNIRMLPIRGTFEKFRRLVHDLARDLGKNVELTMEGAETELDKSVIDQLSDPLMHLIRNSMDHGIGSPEVRAAHGKRVTATIHLSARHSGANVLIGVTDDGDGIDTDAVRGRAIETGLIVPDAQLTEAEIFALLFLPGFSTAKQVTDLSGRGVGMDVVRQRVESLRGTVEVTSKRGQRTSVTLRLPLTLAIIDGLLVSVGASSFVLPLGSTLECVELSDEDIERANGKHVAEVRGELIPYIRLREQFHLGGARPAIEQIMVVESSAGRYGFVVDQVLGNCQTVIKSLGRVYRHVQTVSGATILGDGQVALILDPDRLVQDAVRDATRHPRGHPHAAGCGRTRDGTLVNA